LKIKHINIQSNLITIPGHTSKNRKSQSVTIPDDLLIFMEKFRIEDKDQEAYIIGKGLMPATEQCGTNSLNNFHRKILEKLKTEKRIKNIQGISIYSWKDTGALELVSKGIDILQLKDQMRHSSLETTNCYIRSLGNVNEKIKSISGTMPLTILSLQSDLLNDTPSGS
jgi:integrase